MSTSNLIATAHAAGFLPVKYPDQDGIFHKKKVPADKMPCLRNEAFDEDLEDVTAIVEITPDSQVILYLPEVDFLVGMVPSDSEDGQTWIQEASKIASVEGR